MGKELEIPLNLKVDPADLGPAMRSCTPRERAFVFALVVCGGKTHEAARLAGFGKESDTKEREDMAVRSAGYSLMRRERVLEAIKEEAIRRLRSAAMVAADRLVILLDDPLVSKRDQKAIASELLDRGGLIVQQRVEIVNKTEREQDVIRDITALAKNLGLDPSRLLGNAPPVVDAEFTVVEGSAEGLEDLL